MLPVSLSRSIAADRSLTHPKNADGEDKFNELADVLLPLFVFPFAGSRDEEEPELFADDPTFELLLDELFSKKISLIFKNLRLVIYTEKKFETMFIYAYTKLYVPF